MTGCCTPKAEPQNPVKLAFVLHNAPMTLTELRYIVAVARERHFGRAAEACFVSQPTLSVAIKKLEEELDVKIFERGSSEVSMTPLGEAIVRQAQQVLEQAQGIREIAERGRHRRTHGGRELHLLDAGGAIEQGDLRAQA